MNRRGFLTGLIAAPAIVPFASLMPIRGIIMDVPKTFDASTLIWDAVPDYWSLLIWDAVPNYWSFSMKSGDLVKIGDKMFKVT